MYLDVAVESGIIMLMLK